MSIQQLDAGIRVKVRQEWLDDIKEEVHMAVSIALCLRLPDEDVTSCDTVSPPHFTKLASLPDSVTPHLEMCHTVSCELTDELIIRSNRTDLVYVIRHYQVVTRDSFLLQQFPFDRQVNTLKMLSFTHHLQKWFGPEEDLPPRIHADKDWLSHDVVVKYLDRDWLIEWSDVKVLEVEEQWVLEVQWGITRNPLYYLMNFVLVMFVVVQSAALCVAVGPEDFGSRASLVFTLLLSVITFKMVTSSYVPKISYQTYLDLYSMVGLIFIAAVMIENFLLSPFFFPAEGRSGLPAKLDAYFVLVFTVLWVSLHVLIVLGAKYKWFTESWESAKKRENFLHTHAQKAFADVKPVAKSSSPGVGAPALSHEASKTSKKDD